MAVSDTKHSQTGLRRLSDLYRDGGFHEVQRGIRDYLLIDTRLPLHRLQRTAALHVNGHTVHFQATSKEALWRAGGHGERNVQANYLQSLDASDTVWDVGANLGTYSLLAASTGATAIAFEPGPRARTQLVENAQLNNATDQIDATPYALSDYDGTGKLLPAERSGIRQLAPNGDHGDTVPVRRGDSLDLPQPDVVKIDVEGAELSVLDGLQETLANARVCYVEVHDGVDQSAVEARLDGAGLSVTAEFGDDPILRGEVSE